MDAASHPRNSTPRSASRWDTACESRFKETLVPSKTSAAVLILLLLTGGCFESRSVVDPSTHREIEQGKIVGASIRDGAVHAWRGIPFAAPPLGESRWLAPRLPDSWTGVREALESGSACPQLGGDPIMGNEDCLYLDIFSPASAIDAESRGASGLPVMYWIHGGGNSMGSGDMLDVSRLAAEHDVVVVAINYRLGIFGWLSHPALRATIDDPDDASGNFGTLDMIRGLEWVRDNIAAFGGDPNRVTIFGESAGGIDVFSLLLSRRARGLFHGAISQSGSPISMTRIQAENYTDEEDPGLPGSSAELLISLLRQSGRADSRDTAKEVAAALRPSEIEEFLRGLSTEELLEPFVEVANDSAFPIYVSPNIIRDGHVIPTTAPLELFSTPGEYNEVPFIAGTNREEHKLFFAMTSPHVSRIFGIPTGFENLRLYDIESEYGGLIWRATGVDQPISRMREVQGPSVWSYRFDWDEEPSVMGTDLSKLIGAGHGVELIFVFGLTDLGFANRFLFEDLESARILSDQIRSYWAEFAHTLHPGSGQGDDLLEWAPWDPASGRPKYMKFDSARDGGLSMGSDEINEAFVLDRASHDPRLLDDGERCGVLRNLMEWSDALSVEGSHLASDGACQGYPLEPRLVFPSLGHMSESN
jgi:para-nitrobenzyl esterase